MASNASLSLCALAVAMLGTTACGSDDTASTSATGAGAGGATSAGAGGATGAGAGGAADCALTADTTPSGVTSDSGCAVLDRDTTSCAAAREALGLTGFWQAFSCRVTLTIEGDAVVVSSDDRPDHASNYFHDDDACHEDYSGAIQNPNWIEAHATAIRVPLTPTSVATAMQTAVVGIAVDGVVVFGNFAAPGDDIFEEALTFDRCGGHPQMTGQYHYHSEPYAITYDDARFVGVLRDGYAVYGRRDADGTLPADLDAYGGHIGATADSPSTPTYHYHVNEQTSDAPGTAGEKQWFLTTGTYRGAPAACDACN
jgi:hypothetical protein